MAKFVVDASAWIDYLIGSEKGKKFLEVIESNENEIFTSSGTIAEIITKTLKENREVEKALEQINNISAIIGVTNEIGVLAGYIHFEAKKKNKNFGMLDAFVAATAKNLSAKILTGDNDFRNFKEAVLI